MSGFDCYCALCGGPFVRIRFSRAPADTSEQVEEHDGTDGSDQSMVSDDGDDEFEDEEDEDEEEESMDDDDDESITTNAPVEGAYEPDILSKTDIAWAKNLICLGFNPLAKGPSKAFLTGIGKYEQDGTVDVPSDWDPNIGNTDTYQLVCYSDPLHLEPLFPFHTHCAQLLMVELTGHLDPRKLDRDALYGVCQSLMGKSARRLGIEYHEPGSPETGPDDLRTWRSVAGFEYLAICPLPTDKTKTQVRSDMGCNFRLTVPDAKDLSGKVRSDPFSRMPLDVLHDISAFVDNKSLLSLDLASWHVHAKLHGDSGFWKQRTKHNLQWFTELQEELSDVASFRRHDAKALFRWAMKVSGPRQGLTGPYMVIANRRRIWPVAEEIKRRYLSRLSRTTGYEPVDQAIQDNVTRDLVPFVSAPVCHERSLTETFWLHSGEEISKEKVLETFWEEDGSLVGMSITPLPGKRRVFGRDESQPGVSKEVVHIPKGDWIMSFDLHIQNVKPTRTADDEDSGLCVTPRGITIRLESGQSFRHGDTKTECLRHLEASNGSYIVGAIGDIGLLRSKAPEAEAGQPLRDRRRILRFGVIQAKASALNRPARPRIASRGDPPLDHYLWNTKSAYQGEHPIWAWPRLTMHDFGGASQQWASQYCHEDVLSVEAFMWAHSPLELKSLVKIVAVIGKTKLPKSGRERQKFRRGILTLRAEYSLESGLHPRQTSGVDVHGELISEEQVEEFEIDGPGGEYIKEVMVPMSGNSEDETAALMLRTNRKRSVCFAEPEDPAWMGMAERKSQSIVGIVVSFGMFLGPPNNTEERRQAVMGFCAGLTLPSGHRR